MADDVVRCAARIWPSWANREVTCGSPIRNGRCAKYSHRYEPDRYTETDLRAQLEMLEGDAKRLREQLDRVHDEQERLETVLAGPRVLPVLAYWQYHRYEEVEVESVEAGMRRAEVMSEMETGAPVGVFVGGDFTPVPWDVPQSEQERQRALADHRKYVRSGALSV